MHHMLEIYCFCLGGLMLWLLIFTAVVFLAAIKYLRSDKERPLFL